MKAYNDNNTYKLPTKTVRTYYKYQYNDWTQPTLTANGSMGGSSFAVICDNAESSYPIYKAFDDNASTFSSINIGQPCEIIIYNPNPLRITNFEITNRMEHNLAITGYTIYGSTNNSNWVEIVSGTNKLTSSGAVWNIDMSENQTAYKYYKIAVTSATTDGGNFQVAEINITAQEQIAVKASESDYDTYEDKLIYYGIGD